MVSILIPAHNAEPWIGETIQSALAQTWQNKEIIVVDDGSTDRTLARAKEFESAGVKVVHQFNQGGCAARNHALTLSKGDYIQWLDADDLLTPDKIANQIEALGPGDSKNTLLASGWGRFIARPSRVKYQPTALWCDLSPVEHMVRKFEQGVFLFTASWLVSRELTEAAGPWDTRLVLDQDGEYFCRVILASDRYASCERGEHCIECAAVTASATSETQTRRGSQTSCRGGSRLATCGLRRTAIEYGLHASGICSVASNATILSAPISSSKPRDWRSR